MKTRKYVLTLIFGLLIAGCADVDIGEEITIEQRGNVVTRGNQDPEAWDLCSECILSSERKVSLPWVVGTQTTIPDEIRNDISRADGWIVLCSTVTFIGSSVEVLKTDRGVNYLLLYNVDTGMLKGFYYAEEMSATNNCGFWELRTSSPTKLFNFTPYFAEPMNGECPQHIAIANITNGETAGFEKGWNCFQTELAYDENSHKQRLNISGYALNKATIKLSGAYNSSSSGMITTSSGKSSAVKGVASAVGSKAKEWVKKNTGKSSSKVIKYGGDLVAGLAQSGVSSLITSGIYKVFGSFLGVRQRIMI